MTTRSVLLALSILVLYNADVHCAESRGGLISLRHRDQAVEHAPDTDRPRPGHTSVGEDASLYLVNSAPTNPVWLRIMGEDANLYRVRVDDPSEYDPNSVILGLRRWFGSSLLLSGTISSERGREDMVHLRDDEKSVTQMLQVDATHMSESGLIASVYAALGRTFDVPPGHDAGIPSRRRFNRTDHHSLNWNAGVLLGYGRRLFSTVSIRASAGISFMKSVEDHQYRLKGSVLDRLDNHSRVASTSIPLDFTVRYHKALSETSQLLFETSVGLNHTLKVHEGMSFARMTTVDGSVGATSVTKSFERMKNVVYMGAGIGYRRERLAAWLRYDQGRHGPAVMHTWTATLGWSF